jgi:hypothetical protein
MLIVPDDDESAALLGAKKTIRLAQDGYTGAQYAYKRQMFNPQGTGINQWYTLPSRSLYEMFNGGEPFDDTLYELELTPTARIRVDSKNDDPYNPDVPSVGALNLYYREKFLWFFNPTYITRMNYLMGDTQYGWAHNVMNLLYKEYLDYFPYIQSSGVDLKGANKEAKIVRLVAGKIRIQVLQPGGSWPQLLTGEYSSSLSIYIDKGYGTIKDAIGSNPSYSPQPDVSRQLLVQWKTTKKSGLLQYVTHSTTSDFFVEQDSINTGMITISVGEALANKPIILRAVLNTNGTTRAYGINALGFSYDPTDPAGKKLTGEHDDQQH